MDADTPTTVPQPPHGERAPAPPEPGEVSTRPLNALTVDVEDYFHVEAFRSVVDSRKWDEFPLRVDGNTRRILDLFDRHGVHATFFILGWVAERCPDLVREIASRGHEIGCHSYWHRLIYTLDRDEFRRDTEEATRRLEDLSGGPVRSYRAPSYSVVPRSTWALEILADLGYEVDSSIFPIRHDIYGYPSFPRFPVRVELPGDRTITEVPMSTWRRCGMQLPGPGGGYLRIFPLAYARAALRQLNRREGRSGVIYLHPWEIDPDQPRIRARARSRFRHYTGLARMERKLDRLLGEFPMGPLGEVLKAAPPADDFRIEPRPE